MESDFITHMNYVGLGSSVIYFERENEINHLWGINLPYFLACYVWKDGFWTIAIWKSKRWIAYFAQSRDI